MTDRDIHFLGICGVGMAGVAALLRARGENVSGCDLSDGPRARWLRGLGIAVATGHSPGHLEAASELVVTPAVPEDAPELAAARARGMRIRRRGEVLAELFNASRGIAVCGTHGKTTTATFAARLLKALGADPAWCIGGECGEMPVASPGAGPLVAEADESDGTLALYRPDILVLNAIDLDHLEHFASDEEYFGCYRSAVAQTRTRVIVCADHPAAAALAREAARCEVTTFGLSDTADVRAADWPAMPVRGRHNVRNALAAVAVAQALGYGADAIRTALPGAVRALPDRRFETVAERGGARVVTDYAHHPAELRCAMDMALECAPSRLRVIFQPHRYSRTAALLEEFPPAFDGADEVVLVPVYAAFEEPVAGGDVADLYRAFRERGAGPGRPRTILARSAEEAWKHAYLTMAPGDLVVIAGAGDVVRVLPRVREDMAKPAVERAFTPLAPLSFFRTGGRTCGGGERLTLGMGSNTWFPDCDTDVEIVRATGDAARPGAELGIPFMAGIPGSAGGWVKMNAGAFGHTISELVASVTLADGRTLTAAECGFGYRTSAIDGVIESVRFLPAPADAGSAEDYRARRPRFPPRTCGSVFRNPPGDHAGRLLEAAGAKSLRVGGARVWEGHANVIVAEDGANSSDILALSRLMALAVRRKFGIILKPEIAGL